MTILYIVSIWFIASFMGVIAFCWLLKTKRIAFEAAPSIDDWLEGRAR